jgi:3-oxoacyl-[acyl-carrier-protein] synthase-3
MEQAMRDGLVDEEHQNIGYESITVAEDVSGPEMAVRAGRLALERSGIDRGEVGLVLHASGGYQGHDLWPAAAYVANETVGAAVPGFDVQQRCNGATASAYIRSGFTSTVLLTHGDNFALPWIDRWNLQLNLILADGGSALVLSSRAGFARLLSATVGAENSLERWSRGDAPFGTVPGHQLPVPLRARGDEYTASPDAEGAWERYEAGLKRTTQQALDEANLDYQDISRIIVPLIHRGKSPENYELLGFTEKQSTWDIGRRVGHIGAGDQFLGLERLVEDRAVGPGDLLLIVAAGTGFSYSAAVVEVLEVPSW